MDLMKALTSQYMKEELQRRIPEAEVETMPVVHPCKVV